MRKYLLVMTIIWLVFTLLAIIIAMWNYLNFGMHNAWWYFVAIAFSMLMFMRRYWQWKKTNHQEKIGNKPEN
jgi:4-hydroxybenzoate polyprenyltransferase